jgi:uncharacterized protein
MKPRVTVITIGVDNLERSLAFYRDGLGFPTQGIIGTEFEHGAVVFIDLQSGLKLELWPRESIAHDTGLARVAPSATELTLGHNVASKKGSRRGDGASQKSRRRDRKAGSRHVLGRV